MTDTTDAFVTIIYFGHNTINSEINKIITKYKPVSCNVCQMLCRQSRCAASPSPRV